VSPGLQKSVFNFDFLSNLKTPFSRLLLQIILIIFAARVFGFILRKLGHPTVMGEILAGIVLGPSLAGYFFPGFYRFMFPEDSVEIIRMLSQIGLILFMFIIGMELDFSTIKRRANSAIIISSTSIIFPFVSGVIMAFFLYSGFAPLHTSFYAFSLFLGIAMSITAFPVLSRIILEKGMTKSYIGIMALACAAFDDITGWCLLATVIAIAKAGSILSCCVTIGLSLIYILLMFSVIRPILKRAGNIYISKENLNKTVIAIIFLFLFISAYITDIIGIHALFGAFIAGVIMPQNQGFKKIIVDKIEDVSVVLLLPLFFVFTGLRTHIDMINNGYMWLIAIIVIIVAIAGKFGGGVFASRVVGMSWKNSLILGTLMNTRGLMELIVLNVGYEMGILSSGIFTILVIMALVTTFMTGPLLNLIEFIDKKISGKRNKKEVSTHKFRILLSFARPFMGSKLLQIASLFYTHKDTDSITALHITPNSQIGTKSNVSFEEEVFTPIKAKADELNIHFEKKYKITENYTKFIISFFKKGKFNLLLLGAAKSMFSESRIGGRIKTLLDSSENGVGIFIDRDLDKINNVFVTMSSPDDIFLLGYIKMIANHQNIRIQVVCINDSPASFLKDKFESIDPGSLERINLKNYNAFYKVPYHEADLTIISLNAWKHFSANKDIESIISSSMLIIKQQTE